MSSGPSFVAATDKCLFTEDTYFSQISLKLKGLEAGPDFSLGISQIGKNKIKIILETDKGFWVDI